MKFKKVCVHAHFNERTGYGIHATNFFNSLEKLIPIDREGQSGDVHISLLDVVTASQTDVRHPYPSILYNVWESTEYPAEFLERIKLYDQLWVPSEWQRSISIAQGIPEEFVKVVPEGVNPEIYKPEFFIEDMACVDDKVFTFIHVGQWQPRKSTLEIIQAFLKAFPFEKNVRLDLSVDTLFPSDNFKSTEERLAHYGVNDPRIRVIHFEDREAYVRRLQSADCFVSCSRSEGWGLPIIESMACGVPTIVADFGGSTEYAGDAVNIRISELKKPQGIYGNWDVPGMWGEPDYDHLVECMRNVYFNYPSHKTKAMRTSKIIRNKFSWDRAARTALDIINQAPSAESMLPSIPVSSNPEDEIMIYARERGYDITSMGKRSVIFTIDTHPTSQAKMDTLVESINQIKRYGFPILVTSHVPLPAPIIAMVDYYIYDKRDILSPETDMPQYWRQHPERGTETVQSKVPCHALAGLHNIRNAIDFCLGKYDWVYSMVYDVEVDLKEWFSHVNKSSKDMILVKYEGRDNAIDTKIMAARTVLFDAILGHFKTWEEYAEYFGPDRFCSEMKYYSIIAEKIGLENVDLINMYLGNRFDQVDRDAWGDDIFICHFVEGPYLQIDGISNREYDVFFSNPVDGNKFHLKQKVGMWGRPEFKFYRDWTISAFLEENGTRKLAYEHKMDLTGKRVLISLGSKALGDTLAWVPYIEEFRKKHNCHVIMSSWWNRILDYPEIEFVEPGSAVQNLYASYEVGCFDDQLDKNPVNWRRIPLQKVAADILGIDYVPLRTKLKKVTPQLNPPEPYICFSEFSTMQNKMWNNPGAWQKVINYLNSIGYRCVSISFEPTQLDGVIKHNGQSIEETITDVSGAKFYIGLNHGPSWLAYSLGIPYIMITGVSEEWNDVPNPYRISVDTGCKPCFNNTEIPIDRGWNWCVNENKFICTKSITPEMVIDTIDHLICDLEVNDYAAKEGTIQ